jgi:hypothetical protein
MSAQGQELRLEGIVHASRPAHRLDGGEFPAIIECSDGTEWVISYGEQSPFHAFADRKVVASGKPYKPPLAHIIRTPRGQKPGYFRVSTMRLVTVTPDAQLVEVEEEQHLSGRFKVGTSDGGKAILSFVTETGTTFLVANEPAGWIAGRDVSVSAYPVQPYPLTPKSPEQYLWIICPYSAQDLWEWRGRSRTELSRW